MIKRSQKLDFDRQMAVHLTVPSLPDCMHPHVLAGELDQLIDVLDGDHFSAWPDHPCETGTDVARARADVENFCALWVMMTNDEGGGPLSEVIQRALIVKQTRVGVRGSFISW